MFHQYLTLLFNSLLPLSEQMPRLELHHHQHARYALHRNNAPPSPMSLLQTALKSSLPRLTATHISKRSFTTTKAIMGKQEWMIILPDKAGALEARMKVRP